MKIFQYIIDKNKNYRFLVLLFLINMQGFKDGFPVYIKYMGVDGIISKYIVMN